MARLCDDATAIGLLGPGQETSEVYRFRHALTRETLLELGDGPAVQRVLPELDRMAESLRPPAARLAALSRRSTVAALMRPRPRPGAAAHLDRAVRTGTRCSYSPPDRPG